MKARRRYLQSSVAERLRQSLFFVPVVFAIAGVTAGAFGIALDSALGTSAAKLPLGFTSTVESARAVLGTIASATITFAGIAFSVSLLTIQLASSQFSPRIVHGLLRDPFTKRSMGAVVGTFTYCLVVLRAIRSPVDGGTPVVPNVSVAVAVLLGLVTILAIVGFIDHSAHSMDISTLLQGVVEDTREALAATWCDGDERPAHAHLVEPASVPTVIRSDGDGWVVRVDHAALLDGLPAGSTMRLDTVAGRYATAGSPLCTVWPALEDPETMTSLVRGAVDLGDSRTMQQDVEYGVRQLVDVALRAVSPGVNDPTTAHDAIVHLAAVLRDAMSRTPPSRVRTNEEGGVLLVPHVTGHDDLVNLAFDELRRAAASLPAVCVYLLDAMGLVAGAVPEPAGGSVALRRQAELVLDAGTAGAAVAVDREAVRAAYERHFGRRPEAA